MSNNFKIQNLTKLYTLTLLKSKKSVTGYYIIKRLESDLGKIASPTYIYDFLNKLQSEGYIKPTPNPKSKKSKGFQLTPSGKDFIDKIFHRFGNLIEVAIESKLKVCASCGVKLYDNYHVETINGKEMNFCCEHCAKAFKESF
ncbi:MAG: helix-turn-helix transcriptional regulator [Candidatus Odinarchaeota archaeon]